MSESGSIRKFANLSRPLHRDLTVYAVAASAAGVSMLALAQSADAEVVYTPVNQTIDAHQGYAIDLNHDGIVDFRIQNLYRIESKRGFYKSFDLLVEPADGVQVGNSQYAVAALPAGVKIGPVQPPKRFGPRGAVMADQFAEGSFGTYYFGSWLNASNRYLGLAFNIDGQVHFGWARLTVHWNRKWTLSARITGYAYETEPNKPIIAGDEGSRSADGTDSGPTSEMLSEPQIEVKPAATLAALALGAGGLDIWRSEQQQRP